MTGGSVTEKITPETYEKMNEEFVEDDLAFTIRVPTQEEIDQREKGTYLNTDFPKPDLVAEHWKEHNRREALKNADKGVEAPEAEVDKHGFTIKPRITDSECIIACLQNAPCGIDKKQAAKLIEKYKGIQYD